MYYIQSRVFQKILKLDLIENEEASGETLFFFRLSFLRNQYPSYCILYSIKNNCSYIANL